jgi:hypothetical protein
MSMSGNLSTAAAVLGVGPVLNAGSFLLERRATVQAPGTQAQRFNLLQRETLEELTNFGDGGRQPDEFYAVHNIATDSKGNVFTTVTKKDQGILWPVKR